jgi:phage head maturation protease
MLDTGYNRELLPGLEAGVYGSSFRFKVTREDVDQRPQRSEHNPEALPERTVREVELFEMGPVTVPAYADTTAGVRSLTDWYVDAAALRLYNGTNVQRIAARVPRLPRAA